MVRVWQRRTQGATLSARWDFWYVGADARGDVDLLAEEEEEGEGERGPGRDMTRQLLLGLEESPPPFLGAVVHPQTRGRASCSRSLLRAKRVQRLYSCTVLYLASEATIKLIEVQSHCKP
eukprot:5502725-Pyramimonas_sp.AAC.2